MPKKAKRMVAVEDLIFAVGKRLLGEFGSSELLNEGPA